MNPNEYTGIVKLSEQEILVNIKLIDGIYTGITVPVILKFPNGYPFEPPFGYIKSDYNYNHRHN